MDADVIQQGACGQLFYLDTQWDRYLPNNRKITCRKLNFENLHVARAVFQFLQKYVYNPKLKTIYNVFKNFIFFQWVFLVINKYKYL